MNLAVKGRGWLAETGVTTSGAPSGWQAESKLYMKEKKEGKRQGCAANCSGTQGLFPLPLVVTLIMRLGTYFTKIFHDFRSGNHRFPRISADATPKYHILNQIFAQGIDQHSPSLPVCTSSLRSLRAHRRMGPSVISIVLLYHLRRFYAVIHVIHQDQHVNQHSPLSRYTVAPPAFL